MAAMMMDGIAQQECLALQSWLNGAFNLWLELYANSVAVDPSRTNPGLYLPANYIGYNPWGILGSFGAPVRVQAGVWYTQSGPWTFAANGNPAPYTIYGWTLRRVGVVIAAEAFVPPVVLPPGVIGPALTPRLIVGSQSVLCPE